MPDQEYSVADKVRVLLDVASTRRKETALVVVLSVVVALAEAVGIGFILPVIEIAQSGDAAANADGPIRLFVLAFEMLGIPFQLEYVILVIMLTMTIRYLAAFLLTWTQFYVVYDYVCETRRELFAALLEANVSYFDRTGSDQAMNAVITETKYAGDGIKDVIQLFRQITLIVMYLSITLYLLPFVTLVSIVAIGSLLFVSKSIIEGAYAVGDRAASANERIQSIVQSGVQGIRDIKLFGLEDRQYSRLDESVTNYFSAMIQLRRNKAALRQLQQLIVAVGVFGAIYVALTFLSLTLGTLALFLFTMFRLAPQATGLSSRLYNIDGYLPHLVRNQEYIEELRDAAQTNHGTEPVPDRVEQICFDDVRFSYDDEETVLDGVSLEIDRGDFVAFVGRSGAGKSTIVSLLTRMYEPDAGSITANGVQIDKIKLDQWRSKMAVVRQDPFIFDDTLWFNLTITNPDATKEEVEQACEIAQVTEYFDELPNGYETELGEDGVQLSGGQRQRLALARALLKDAELLVLDEATSDLDTSIEDKVQSAIESLDREYTIVTIAHRLSTVKNADRIYTLEDGDIVESGTHDELLTNGQKYAELYSHQADA
jgi:subfamily B ATP-binding cassette protein MsbA